MTETHIETDMLVRTIEADGAVLVTVDGSFESRTFRIPTEDAALFAIADFGYLYIRQIFSHIYVDAVHSC